MPARRPPQSSQRTRVTVIMLVGVFMALLDLFIVNIAYPTAPL
jgi:hypothetical protein